MYLYGYFLYLYRVIIKQIEIMKTLKELQNSNKEVIFFELYNFVTTEIKNDAVLDIIKTALLGVQSDDVINYQPAFIISELCAKGYLNTALSDTLSQFAINSNYK